MSIQILVITNTDNLLRINSRKGAGVKNFV